MLHIAKGEQDFNAVSDAFRAVLKILEEADACPTTQAIEAVKKWQAALESLEKKNRHPNQ